MLDVALIFLVQMYFCLKKCLSHVFLETYSCYLEGCLLISNMTHSILANMRLIHAFVKFQLYICKHVLYILYHFHCLSLD